MRVTNMKKRLIALLLSMVMVLGTGTMFVFAEDAEEEQANPGVDTVQSEEDVQADEANTAITSQPRSATIYTGDKATFKVSAAGEGLTYQWQYKNSKMSDFANTNLAGCNTDTLSFTAAMDYDGIQFRCLITDANGDTVASNAAKLTVVVKPFTLEASASVDKTGAAVVTIKASGEGADAVSYYIVRALKDGVADPAVAEVKTESSKATFSGLSGIYSFEVEAFHEEKITEINPETGEEVVVDTKTESLGKTYTEEVFVAAITNFALYPSHKSIALEWDPIEGVSYYEVYRNGELRAKVEPDSRAYDNPEMMAFIDEGMAEQVSLAKYTYRVKAVLEEGDKIYASAPSDNLTGSCVQQMYVSIKFKAKTTLTSHEGLKKKHTFNKNEVVYAHGYLLGKHQFYYTINGKKYLFYTKYTRMKNASAKYTTSFNYDEKSAEYYVNFHKNADGSVGFASNTRNLIWVNRYTQHVYVFEKVNGYWRLNESVATKGSSKRSSIIGKLYRDWECSTGKSSSPSPTGTYKIFKRQKSKHGHKWWNYYHSQTALHGKVKGTVWGTPRSSGCIRNPDPNAEFIYFNTAKYTKVNIY